MASRPTKFTQILAFAICTRIANGESLRSICRDEAMPTKSTVLAWLADDARQEFRTKYALAREIQAEGFVDEMVEIADDGTNDWMEKMNAAVEVTGYRDVGFRDRASAQEVASSISAVHLEPTQAAMILLGQP